MVIRRLTEQDAEVGVQAIRLLKSIDGYPITGFVSLEIPFPTKQRVHRCC